MRSTVLFALLCLALPVAGRAQLSNDDQVSPSFLLGVNAKSLHVALANAGMGSLGSRSNGGVLGVDSLPNWSSSFYYPGQDSLGNPQYAWQYTMVGNSPFARSDGDNEGATTTIGAPVIPVSLDLRNADGTVRFVNGHRLYSDATQYLAPALKSPVFAKTFFDSSDVPTQFADSVMRAEFYHQASDQWHTLLNPRAETPRTMVLLRGTYLFALNQDGTCCLYVLIDANTFGNALFPATATDTTTPIGAAENSGEMRTTDLSTFLFPNAFLFENGDPNQCCILGFHSYDLEPGSEANGYREKRYVMDYASWVTAPIFGDPTFMDVVALSHEITEAFNDPFVGNATPWWLAPNGLCQNNLETGDVIEGLPNGQYPINLNGMTYHPQNEALLQWFAGIAPSSAIHKAYSYPDTTVLTSAAVSQTAGCTGPLVATARHAK